MNSRARFWACLAVSAAALALPFAMFPSGGTLAGGNSGTGQVTLTAASASLAGQAAQWIRPPETQNAAAHVQPPAPPPAASAPAVPVPARPQPLTPAPSLPHAPTQAAVPESLPDLPSPPPPPQQAEAPEKQPPSAESAPQETAAGSGHRQAEGAGGRNEATTGNPARDASLKTRWGASILARVERRKRQPRGGGKGTAAVRLTVSTQGQLISAAIAATSGHQALDQAALKAAQAARYPRAPKDLRPGEYSFRFTIRFK